MNESIPMDSPSLSRRQFLNFLTGAVVAATAGSALYPATKFFLPPSEVREDGGILAVVRGPANRPLKLARVVVQGEAILLYP
ncbi:MAG: twin-arginine translocation signal domain-containing protein [Leptolyngbyaceae bacterium]|nr:twin-arginine translocation signal domain-containing protein [Leptolyngbyaceae bacterium]